MNWGAPYDSGALDLIEKKWSFAFPPDLRDLLLSRRPLGDGFVDWENDPDDHIRRRLGWPLDGLLFDVDHGFWLPEWGDRPDDPSGRAEIVKCHVANAPKLIPICGHRYISELPKARNNPILSVYQTDIIVCGGALGAYFQSDHRISLDFHFQTEDYNAVPFWDRIAEWHFEHWEPET